MPLLEDVNSDLLDQNPQLSLRMDRDRISALGLTPGQVETALYSAYGTRQVSQIYAAEQSVSGDHAGRAGVSARCFGAVSTCTCVRRRDG